jgi:hypothetical protein
MLRIRSLLGSVAVLAVRSPIVATFCSSSRAYLQGFAIIMNWPKGSSYEGTLEAWAGNGGAKERVEAKQEGKSK